MSQSSMQDLWASAPLANTAYIDHLYELYLQDPKALSSDWQAYFKGLAGCDDVSHAAVRDAFLHLAKRSNQPANQPVSGARSSDALSSDQSQVLRFISAYRRLGHQTALLDPLNLAQRMTVPELDPTYYGFDSLDSAVDSGDFSGLSGTVSLKTLMDALQKTYCRSVGIEYMHITNLDETTWIQGRCEAQPLLLNPEEKIKLLDQLIAAEGLEKYLATKYVGQKRFGLEGGESLIPALHQLVNCASQSGVKDFLIGMAHRGRLNVLVNILGKSPADLFDEFEGKLDQSDRTGDVKYHMGFSSWMETPHGDIHLVLGFNPSHLEIIDPVIEGSVRARQQRRGDLARDQVFPVLLHGDAAFAGQGVVMETFALSQARGYKTGGTVHVVVNNQIGFTTSSPLDARSSLYCTDIAKMVQAPVIHVNADHPESVIWAAQLAFDYRMRFKKDVVLDLVCYRRHGHNEADEPSMTQPVMYATIKKHPSTCKQYSKQLVDDGLVTQEAIQAKTANYRQALDERRSVVDVALSAKDDPYAVDWTSFLQGDLINSRVKTAVDLTTLQAIAGRLFQLPENFTLQAQVAREMKAREQMLAGKIPLNWGCAETLAYATLLKEGFCVRLSGQDSGRGTFSHRHAILHNQTTRDSYIPLKYIDENQAKFTVINSVLSELAVLGFEYGYSTAEPNSLVLWEAQFGDFANGAQIVFDQFISSGEQKWGRLCGLVLLLPHGYEGQGPEHSSARLERYLQLCAQHNMQVCVPSTPAQIFHVLRRQMVRPVRKPLIIMTPKSMLRHKLATSPLDQLTTGEFQEMIPDMDRLSAEQVTRVVFCSGKVYYDLLEACREQAREDLAILRIEQLYPFPTEVVTQTLADYSQATDVVWCQEEPMNQGAWYSTRHRLQACLSNRQTLHYAGREHFASPAVGSARVHKEQQHQLVKEALG